MSTKKHSTKPPPNEAVREDANLLFNVMNDESTPAEARYHLACYCDEITDNSTFRDLTRHRALFLKLFVDGWQQPESAHTRAIMRELFARLKAGESAEAIIADFTAWQRTPAPEQSRDERIEELAEHLSAVMGNPLTPVDLYNAIGDEISSMGNVFNSDSIEFITGALKAHEAAEAKRTGGHRE